MSPWRVPGVAILTAVLIALPWLLHHGLHRLAAGRVHARSIVIHRQPLWLVLVLMLVAWFVLGLSFYTLASAVCALSLVDLPALTFAWAASSILSLAVVFVPMGIGVKEGALAFLLGFRVPIVVATVIAVLARVISVVSEALCFLLAQKL